MKGEPAVRPERRYTALWALLIIFALPVIAAWFFYYNPEYLPATRSNRGELIQPVIPFPGNLVLRDLDDEPFDAQALQGKWTLIALYGAPCQEACRTRIRDLRQIRLALGENRFSVERLFIIAGAESSGGYTELAQQYSGMHVVSAGRPVLQEFSEKETEPGGMNHIYILDPMGNLMMRYRPDAPASDILKDLERLLKSSKSWIKGAHSGHQ